MQEASLKKERFLWIDYAKSIGIFSVVWAHTVDYVLGYEIISWVSAYVIPFFFFISGYLTSEKDSIKTTIVKGFRGIMIPYFAFHLLMLVFYFVSQSILDPTFFADFWERLGKCLLGILLGDGYSTSFSINLNTPLWFLPCLFLSKIVLQYFVINKNHRTLKMVLVAIACGAITYFLNLYEINIFFSIDSAIMGLPFYVLGFIFKERNLINKLTGLPLEFLIVLSFLAANIYLGYINQTDYNHVDMNTIQYGHSLILFYITGFFGVLAVIFVAKILSRINFPLLSLIGINTLVVLGLHYILIKYIKMGWEYILSKLQMDFNPVLMYVGDFSIAIIVVLICVPAIFIIKKHFPFMIGQFKTTNKKTIS